MFLLILAKTKLIPGIQFSSLFNGEIKNLIIIALSHRSPFSSLKVWMFWSFKLFDVFESEKFWMFSVAEHLYSMYEGIENASSTSRRESFNSC